jgi:putative ABC transport system permease protein
VQQSFNKLIVSNLLYRPIRSLISITGVAVEIVLILVIVGLLLGILDDSRQRQQGMGADIMVQPPGTSFMMGLSGLPMSVKYVDIFRKLPHVTAVTPVGVQLNTTGGVETIYGIEPQSFEKIAGPFSFLSGGLFQQPDEVVVDDFFAKANHVRVGSSIDMLNHNFRVSGIVEHGKGARKYISLSSMEELVGSPAKASIFYLKVDDPTQDNVRQVISSINSMHGGSQLQVRSMREWLTLMTAGNVPGFSTVVNVVIGVAVVIGFIVIFQTMYTAVLERTREIGILKSLGSSKVTVVNLVLREALLLALCGAVIGICVSFLAGTLIHNKFPTMNILIQGRWIIYASVIAMAGAMLGASYPAYQAAKKDPIDALAYE